MIQLKSNTSNQEFTIGYGETISSEAYGCAVVLSIPNTNGVVFTYSGGIMQDTIDRYNKTCVISVDINEVLATGEYSISVGLPVVGYIYKGLCRILSEVEMINGNNGIITGYGY
jgi:hypothetical protein